LNSQFFSKIPIQLTLKEITKMSVAANSTMAKANVGFLEGTADKIDQILHLEEHDQMSTEDMRDELAALRDRITAHVKAQAKAKPDLYLVRVISDIEPGILGPYETNRKRFTAAKKLRRENGDEDGLFKLSVDSAGQPSVETYAGGDFM
jgi:hypothetical protein